MDSDSKIFSTAIKLAKDVSPIFRKSFGCPRGVSKKNGDYRNLVTEVDLAIEHKLRRSISKQFPDHGIIGEEVESHSHTVKTEYIWIIDPIDGTTNYIHGIPYCCISIGVFKNHKPFIGVIYNPITNQFYAAQKGKGATKNGKKIHVSKAREMKKSFGAVAWGHDGGAASVLMGSIVRASNKIRVFGSHALSMCEVAAATCDYFVDGGSTANIWDIAASQLIVSEAGGISTDVNGNPLHGFHCPDNIISAATRPLHKELLSFLNTLSA